MVNFSSSVVLIVLNSSNKPKSTDVSKAYALCDVSTDKVFSDFIDRLMSVNEKNAPVNVGL